MGMQQLSLMTMIAMCCGLSNQAVAKEENQSRQVALAVVSLMLEGDFQGTAKYFSPNAESKTAGKGSAIAKLKLQRPDMLEKVDLENIVFFKQADIAKLSKSYPDNMWQRVSQRIDSKLGCLVVVGMAGTEQKGMLLMLVGQEEGNPRIVYTDDN